MKRIQNDNHFYRNSLFINNSDSISKLPYYLLNKIIFYLYEKQKAQTIANLRFLCREYHDFIDRDYQFVRYEIRNVTANLCILHSNHIKIKNNLLPKVKLKKIGYYFSYIDYTKNLIVIKLNNLMVRPSVTHSHSKSNYIVVFRITKSYNLLDFEISYDQYRYLTNLFHHIDPRYYQELDYIEFLITRNNNNNTSYYIRTYLDKNFDLPNRPYDYLYDIECYIHVTFQNLRINLADIHNNPGEEMALRRKSRKTRFRVMNIKKHKKT